MKTIIPIICLLTCVSVGQGCLSQGWDIDFGHKSGQTTLKKTPKIIFVKRVGEVILIKVVNNTGEDLTYDGYAEGDPPCFFKTKMHSHGGWSASYSDMYWGGVSRYTIKDGESVTMKVKPMIKIYQIFIMLKSKADNKRFSFIKLYENEV